MTRHEIIRHVVMQAHKNGFEFRTWFKLHVDPEWTTFEAAIALLSDRRRFYILLFSHEFAESFWKAGVQVQFMVPAVSYTRRDNQGNIITVHRKAFTRRTLKADSWRYHLREMADSPQPLKYIRRFIVLAEDLQSQLLPETGDTSAEAPPSQVW